MLNLSAALAELADDCRSILTAAGVTDPVVTDADAITPPCVYVHLSAISALRLAGYDLAGLVDIVAPNVGADPQLSHLSRMAGPLVDELHLTGEAQFVQLAAPGAGAPYPTLRLNTLITQP